MKVNHALSYLNPLTVDVPRFPKLTRAAVMAGEVLGGYLVYSGIKNKDLSSGIAGAVMVGIDLFYTYRMNRRQG